MSGLAASSASCWSVRNQSPSAEVGVCFFGCLLTASGGGVSFSDWKSGTLRLSTTLRLPLRRYRVATMTSISGAVLVQCSWVTLIGIPLTSITWQLGVAPQTSVGTGRPSLMMLASTTPTRPSLVTSTETFAAISAPPPSSGALGSIGSGVVSVASGYCDVPVYPAGSAFWMAASIFRSCVPAACAYGTTTGGAGGEADGGA